MGTRFTVSKVYPDSLGKLMVMIQNKKNPPSPPMPPPSCQLLDSGVESSPISQSDHFKTNLHAVKWRSKSEWPSKTRITHFPICVMFPLPRS